MIKYPKIQSIYKRDEKTHRFIDGAFTLPEFGYLKDNQWVWTEKVDGTNISVEWFPNRIMRPTCEIHGRTETAQIPIHLQNKLQELFSKDLFEAKYPETSITLFGEGYGAKIQGGGKYIPDGVSFILFDVLIDGWWLKREDIEDVAFTLGIDVVPIVGKGTLLEAVEAIKSRTFMSWWGQFLMEGFVLKPEVELKTRSGKRVITKVKHKDFKVSAQQK